MKLHQSVSDALKIYLSRTPVPDNPTPNTWSPSKGLPTTRQQARIAKQYMAAMSSSPGMVTRSRTTQPKRATGPTQVRPLAAVVTRVTPPTPAGRGVTPLTIGGRGSTACGSRSTTSGTGSTSGGRGSTTGGRGSTAGGRGTTGGRGSTPPTQWGRGVTPLTASGRGTTGGRGSTSGRGSTAGGRGSTSGGISRLTPVEVDTGCFLSEIAACHCSRKIFT